MPSQDTQQLQFPVDAVRGAFEVALGQSTPVVLSAPTGSGKSTRIPEWVAEAGQSVLVVEPRRVACRALAGWLARRREEKVGETVGYRVRFEDRCGPRTRIRFVTPGVALNMLAQGIEDVDVVVVDEFHERSWEIDLVVTLVRRLRAASSGPGLVLCSATLDTEALVGTLGAQLISSEGRGFPVDIDFSGGSAPSEVDLDARVSSAVRGALADSKGDVLVFLPGKGEIEACRRALSDISAQVVIVHAGVEPRRLEAAFGRSTERRVFLSTNVAETSLTLPGVTVVVDSGLVRIRKHRGGRSVLMLDAISQASMDQRAGRAGRVAAGRCLRLWGRSYTAPKVTAPEIERTQLDDFVLRAAQCGLAGDSLAQAPFVTPPPAFALEQARARLIASGALDESGGLTSTGQARARVPVSAFESQLLIDVPGPLRGAIADLVALMQVGRDLLSRGDDRIDGPRHELFDGLSDEVFVQLRALRDGDARRHGLVAPTLAEARRLAESLRSMVGAPRLAKDQGWPDSRALTEFLLLRIPEAAFVRRPRADGGRGVKRAGAGEPWGNGEIELSIRPYSVPGKELGESLRSPQFGIVLDHAWIGVGARARGVGRMMLACERADFARAGLGQPVVTEPRRKGKRIVANVQTVFAGVELSTEELALEGASLREAVAELMLAGRLWRGFGDRFRDQRHVQTIVHQLHPEQIAAPLASSEELRARLERVGLEGSSELGLLEESDLLLDLESLLSAAGLDPREVAAAEADFPRLLVHEGGRYEVTVHVDQKRVVLEPVDRAARAKNEPPARILPRFRGYRVDYVKASRRVRLR